MKTSKKIYINYKYNGETETIDEFPYDTKQDRKYANQMLAEYRMSYNGYGCVYKSQRCCKEWTN